MERREINCKGKNVSEAITNDEKWSEIMHYDGKVVVFINSWWQWEKQLESLFLSLYRVFIDYCSIFHWNHNQLLRHESIKAWSSDTHWWEKFN